MEQGFVVTSLLVKLDYPKFFQVNIYPWHKIDLDNTKNRVII